MDEDKIILDRKSFEALAVDSRVKILKSLKQRRKTLSELSQEQKMSVSGVKEHLETLEKVGLIEKKDDGHKWKYYELTKKGSEIIGPREIRVWILLVTAMIALLASFTAMFSVPVEQPDLMMASEPSLKSMDQPEMAFFDNTSDSLASNGGPGAAPLRAMQIDDNPPEPEITTPDLTLPFVVAGISMVTMVGCIYILLKNRSKYPHNNEK